MKEQLTVRQSLIACAEELASLQNSNQLNFTQIEQRHGRADGEPVRLHDRDGAPVMDTTIIEEDIPVISFTGTFTGKLGGVCLNCPVLEAGDGCAIRESFHQIAADMRAKKEALEYKEPTTNKISPTPRKPRTKQFGPSPEVKISSLPEDQLAKNESAEAREQRIQEIAERAAANMDVVRSIYRSSRSAFGYPGSATRLTQNGSSLNQDHTDHIAADD